MKGAENNIIPSERLIAQEVFSPAKFGFTRDVENLGPVWQRAISYSTDQQAPHQRVDLGNITFLPLRSAHVRIPGLPELLDHMQTTIFGVNNPKAGIGSHFLGMPHYVVAYQEGKFNKNGAVGFSVAFGDSDEPGILASKSVGVMPDYQGKADVGWYLRILQANHAVNHGFDSIRWQFNPLLARNASLFIRKLGGEITEFIPKKSGMLNSTNMKLSDKAIVTWNLLSPRVHQRINEVYQHMQAGASYPGVSIEQLPDATVVTRDNITEVQDKETLLYEIPRDFSQLSEIDKQRWEDELNIVFEALLDSQTAEVSPQVITDPAKLRIPPHEGQYTVTDFISGEKNYYIFTRKRHKHIGSLFNS